MPEPSMPRKGMIPNLPIYVENYLLCILFHMLLPLLPVGLELWLTNSVTDTSLTLCASMYAIAIGISSRSRLLFGASIVISILYAIDFGLTVGNHSALPGTRKFVIWGIIAVFFLHALERYNRHVVDRTPFWEFTS
jgi:hypothetical protein